jgi:hypothetical protein
MKGLKITLTHGRVWTAETSDGKRATSSTLVGALSDLLPAGHDATQEGGWVVAKIFDGIRDSGNDGQFQQGRAGA